MMTKVTVEMLSSQEKGASTLVGRVDLSRCERLREFG